MPRADKKVLAAGAWTKLFEFFMSTRGDRDRALQRFGLTPNDAKALHTLDAVDGKPMRALADTWGTDASNATWVVDRLERLGLAERRTPAADRRLKLVVLTPRGREVRDAILRAFHAPPPPLFALAPQELRALWSILDKLAASGAKKAGVTRRRQRRVPRRKPRE